MYKLDAFICHASADKDFAKKLYGDLRKFGIRTWIDDREIKVGDSLYESITNGLLESRYTIVVLSKISLNRPWVKKEIAASFNMEIEQNEKRILPILIDDCDIPIFFKDKRYSDFRHDYDSALHDLLNVFSIRHNSDPSYDLWTHHSIVELDIHDKSGSIVDYCKSAEFTCLADDLTELIEHFTVDGKMTEFVSNIGTVSQIYTQSNVTYVHIKLNNPLKKGDVAHFNLKTRFNGAFCNDSEYWEGKQSRPLDRYTFRVKFPSERPPKNWDTIERSFIKTIPSEHVAELVNTGNRKILELNITNPELHRNYTLNWHW